MKRSIILVLVIVFVIVVGFTKKSSAEEMCGTAVIECEEGSSGNGGYALICWETEEEFLEESGELAILLCN